MVNSLFAMDEYPDKYAGTRSVTPRLDKESDAASIDESRDRWTKAVKLPSSIAPPRRNGPRATQSRGSLLPHLVDELEEPDSRAARSCGFWTDD
jgi:hypothetical protein